MLLGFFQDSLGISAGRCGYCGVIIMVTGYCVPVWASLSEGVCLQGNGIAAVLSACRTNDTCSAAADKDPEGKPWPAWAPVCRLRNGWLVFRPAPLSVWRSWREWESQPGEVQQFIALHVTCGHRAGGDLRMESAVLEHFGPQRTVLIGFRKKKLVFPKLLWYCQKHD